MNLWIRSQDKEILMLVNTVCLAEDEDGTIIAIGIDGKIKIAIGKYKTKERALEVLDEIQETICLDKFNYEDSGKTCYQDCYRYKSDIVAVYEMPKE